MCLSIFPKKNRAHLNDLENIVPYFLICLIYILTDPPAKTAIRMFRIATYARFAHTFVYTIVIITQPARAICFGLHYYITLYMAFKTLMYFFEMWDKLDSIKWWLMPKMSYTEKFYFTMSWARRSFSSLMLYAPLLLYCSTRQDFFHSIKNVSQWKLLRSFNKFNYF